MAVGKNKKYDWDELYEDWLRGSYVNITEFGRKHNINPNSLYSYTYKHKWVEKKKQYNVRKTEQVTQAIIESNKDKAIKYNNEALSQCDSANDVINKYVKSVAAGKTHFNPFAFEKVLNCMERLQKIQRLALGLDKQGINSAAEDSVAGIMSLLQEAIDDGHKRN